MSIRDVTNQLHQLADELEASVSGQSSDADCRAALKAYLQLHMHSMASLSFYLGCDETVFRKEAVPAGQLADCAFLSMMRELEFEGGSAAGYSQQEHGTYNALQQFGTVIEGARL
ncbi:hypothetical protein [Sinorhizobium meliloti]|uniref:hypothetical protein n=1 Tax=Rhizobium meliloti TaxID=382 RepID=UPI000FD7AD23|nr:hypothetical protein [Sinorhizobium meliloti]RVG88706.1 hypothetical protein CN219_03815 [Sinorhizobium meliloti]RVI39012.1 hypothetical protein CN197_02420 [Sinorhizobium meliloti]RVI46648.1 hypothetical protein CN196_09270 [Sinorhizobium meliloti]RVJ25649.1 hypothetical protein CN177_13310 [Sinorhizobium meliloti]RVK02272.1 hypothetical protein CN170_08820 [Sinorhizobium meliloti]